MLRLAFYSLAFICFVASISSQVRAQQLQLKKELPEASEVEIENFYGKIAIFGDRDTDKNVLIDIAFEKNPSDDDVRTFVHKNRAVVIVNPREKKRVDLMIKVPAYSKVRIKSRDGEVRISGYFSSCEVTTETGTISTDVPTDNVRYSFLWTSSYPRFLSSVTLEEVKEKAAGKFLIAGRLGEDEREVNKNSERIDRNKSKTIDKDALNVSENPAEELKDKRELRLDFKTARGIVLFNVNPSEVPSDLRERPLTEAAKAIIRSGDSFLMEAIRRVSPRFFGDYAKTLPPRKAEPGLRYSQQGASESSDKRQAIVKVLDFRGRAISGLEKKDFLVLEDGQQKEIISVEPVTAPMNLVLLLDVSGSVENYIDFIRRTARAFINTMAPKDRIAIVIFNDDVKILSDFTTDRERLFKALDEFDAGGGTAYYDALAYTLVEILKPTKQNHSAIVVISDGDDNRSFLSFNDLIPSIQESGALIYPLYVPSGLIEFSFQTDPDKAVDPVWTKYMSLTSKAQQEGAKLAEISGGTYYQIKSIEQIQKAYDDIAQQLKSAYSITFRSKLDTSVGKVSPRLRVRVLRDGSFAIVEEVKPVN